MLRPLDIFTSLRGIPFLQVFLATAVIGVLLDLRLGALRIARSPLTTLVLVWVGWNLFATAVHGMAVLTPILSSLMTIMILFFVLAHGVQTMKALSAMAALILTCELFLAFVTGHQATRPKTCIALDARDPVDGPAVFDGRSCTESEDCKIDPPLPDADYVCEKVGLFDIYSNAGRVRYTGTLKDPNELALTVALSLPLLYTFYVRRRTLFRGILAAAGALGVMFVVIHTGSRGGVLIVAAMLLVFAVRRFGWRGVVVAGVLASPLMLLGGRGGEEASESSLERMEAAFVGLMLIQAYPVQGVGLGQFTEHHYLTAHNAYLLTATEGGWLGGVLWMCLLYAALKIPLVAFLRYREVPQAVTASRMGFALTASFVGLAVGVFFLSFSYHYVLWTYLGLSGALYGAIRAHDPAFEVKIGWSELAAVAGVNTAMLTVLFFYVRSRV